MHEAKESKVVNSEHRADDKKLLQYMKTFLIPTLLLKGAILYFGIHYSNNPGDGYGYGLVAAICLSLMNFSIFIYKNWSDDDEAK